MSQPRSAQASTGAFAMAAAVVVWASFALSLRAIGDSTLTPADAALIRFGVPSLLLMPWIPRMVRQVRSNAPIASILIACGAGLPFFLVAAWGGSLSSAALIGLIIPGSVPLFAAAGDRLLHGVRTSPRLCLALGLIGGGVAVIVAFAATPQTARGVLILLGGGLLWALYTLSLRGTALHPASSLLLICVPSALATCAGMAAHILPSDLVTGRADAGDVWLFTLVQGAGIIAATLTYAVAVRELGAGRASTYGALAPVLVTIGAIPLLNEVPHPSTVVGLVLIVLGAVGFSLVRDVRPVPDAREQPPRPAVESRR